MEQEVANLLRRYSEEASKHFGVTAEVLWPVVDGEGDEYVVLKGDGFKLSLTFYNGAEFNASLIVDKSKCADSNAATKLYPYLRHILISLIQDLFYSTRHSMALAVLATALNLVDRCGVGDNRYCWLEGRVYVH
ncbi:hypothetical protein P74p21 [Thermus phage P74-26]|uniref:Uncharacterized protein n=1 Tax=Thermus phage P74-26 TaxID=2914007 RepID=A7XXI5_BP742|nr:hypothetical protein P74p21 [Thermus phage P74-26]ABU96971.1 hypothetical protein P74p21 [Thermus phage P74-26]